MAASDQTYGCFRLDMPNVWLKNQNGVSNYPMACQINAAFAAKVATTTEVSGGAGAAKFAASMAFSSGGSFREGTKLREEAAAIAATV